MPRKQLIQLRRDTAANWTSTNPVLAAGEEGYETDTRLRKVGDGTTAWTSLPYAGGGGVVSIIYASGAYPARPASATMAIFRGPVAPTIGGAGNAVDGVDIWVQTS